jgi:hypothetical protein
VDQHPLVKPVETVSSNELVWMSPFDEPRDKSDGGVDQTISLIPTTLLALGSQTGGSLAMRNR